MDFVEEINVEDAEEKRVLTMRGSFAIKDKWERREGRVSLGAAGGEQSKAYGKREEDFLRVSS